MSSQKDTANDLQAYVKLMTDHQGDLRAFIVSLMPGSSDAADVLQETNVVLWLKRSRFELGTNFIAWAFQIARYEVMRHREKTKRSGHVVFSEEMIDILANDSNPVKSDARLAALDSCMQQLSESQKKLLHERYTPGHSLENYAVDSGRSAGGLRMALLRVRETLKDCIKKTIASESA